MKERRAAAPSRKVVKRPLDEARVEHNLGLNAAPRDAMTTRRSNPQPS